VYILKCSDGSLYTGWTNNIGKRIKAHKEGSASKYTRSRRPVKLVYLETMSGKSEALKREREIKLMSRGRKLELIFEAATAP
jgi:putative endonuclease